MAEAEGALSTGVDNLIHVVEEKGEISIQAAAKELGMPEATVESWANFLEEEHMIKIKYKFTKPFLIPAEAKEGEKPGVSYKLSVKTAKKDKPGDIEDKEPITREDGTVVKKVLPVEKEHSATVKEGEGKEVMPEGEGTGKSGDEKGGVSGNGEGKGVDKDGLPETLPHDPDEIMKLAQSYLQKGDFEKAKKLYRKIEEEYSILPKQFEERRTKIVNDLLTLKKDLVSSRNQTSAKEIEKLANTLIGDLKKTKESLDKHDLHSALETFREAESMYKKLPKSETAKKVAYEEEIITIQQSLIKEQLRVALKEWDDTIAKMVPLTKKLDLAIKQGKVGEAFKLYEEIDALKKTLPPAFLREKIALEKKILPYYEKIMALHMYMSAKEVKKKVEHVNELLREVQKTMISGQLGEAVKVFDEAKKVYYTIPNGFLEKKVAVQARLLLMSRKLLDMDMQSMLGDFEKRAQKIRSLLQQGFLCLKTDQWKRAHEIYKAVEKLYGQLPKGFGDRKSRLQMDMLTLYEQLFKGAGNDKKSVEKALGKFNDKDILKLIVGHHELVQKKDFEEMRKNADELFRVMEQKKDKKINPELVYHFNKIKHEIILYDKAMNLENSAKKERATFERELLGVYNLYSSLLHECAIDKELFVYVKSLYLKCREKLGERKKVVKRGRGLVKEEDLGLGTVKSKKAKVAKKKTVKKKGKK